MVERVHLHYSFSVEIIFQNKPVFSKVFWNAFVISWYLEKAVSKSWKKKNGGFFLKNNQNFQISIYDSSLFLSLCLGRVDAYSDLDL